MDFIEIGEMEILMGHVAEMSRSLEVPCPVMIDLKGHLLRTISGNINVESGEEVRITGNKELAGFDTLVIDWSAMSDCLARPLKVGSQVLIDYGKVKLEVVGFESEKTYCLRKWGSCKAQRLTLDEKIKDRRFYKPKS